MNNDIKTWIYDILNAINEIIWAIVIRHLPILQTELEKLLNE